MPASAYGILSLMTGRAPAVIAFGFAAALAVAGCSTSVSHPDVTDSPEPTPTASASPSESPTASPSPTGEITDPVLPPIMIDGPETVRASVGATLNVTTKDVTEVATDNDTVLKVSQPRDDGSAQFNGGAEVIGAGDATMTVTTSDGKSYEVKVKAAK